MNFALTFIVIGAMKAGTTSLYHYLREHPDICMATKKETNYFLGRHEYKRGIEWYLSLFSKAGAFAIGDNSPNYTKRHLWPGVPERIYQLCPDVKLIFLVRDPVQRLMSHYVHNYAHGRERRNFSRILDRDSNYVLTSMYAYQLEVYLQHFPLERMLILDSGQLEVDTKHTLESVFRFLGVKEDIPVINIERRFNVSEGKLRRSILERYVKGERLRRLVQPLVPSRFADRHPFNRPQLDSNLMQQLSHLLSKDVEHFRAITGRPFPEWCI